MVRYEAYIERSWREHGLAQVLVARIRENGSADYGVFLVDLWCLGVKDAFGETDGQESDVRALVDERLPESMREPIHPTCAKKLIEGALAYAERLGFAPHRDFRKARRVLSGIDASLCPMDIVYGRNGRPCFVAGPHDSAERVARVLAILNARLGPENFDFELFEEDLDEVDDEEEIDIVELRKNLMYWLSAEPPEVPRFYELSGMVTALQICPVRVEPIRLLDILWPPGGPFWSDEDEAADFARMMADYWTYVGGLVEAAVAPDAVPEDLAIDLWPEDFPKEDPLPTAAASKEWAMGFLRTTELWPDAWGKALTRPDLAEHWEVIGWWAAFEKPGNMDRIADAAEGTPSRTLAQSIAALARTLRPTE